MNYIPSERLVIVVGNYGSGKTEVCVNLALSLKNGGKKVRIIDLDIVNPYFRCREVCDIMEANDIEMVIPPGAQQFADLPIIIPEIKGVLKNKDELVSILDVGGDDVGAVALSSLREVLGDNPYEMLQVINSKRPFTHDINGCIDMKNAIEESSRLKVTGYVSNAHLIDKTDVKVVLDGARLAKELSSQTKVPVKLISVMGDLADNPEITGLDVPLLKMERKMLPPWLPKNKKGDRNHKGKENLPAARVKPIGRPQ